MLTSASRALVDREPDLPGLDLLLDAPALLEALNAALGSSLDALTVNYLRYKPRTSCLVGYEVRRGEARGWCYATARALQKSAPTGLRIGGLDVHCFPHDRKLPGLRGLLPPEGRSLMANAWPPASYAASGPRVGTLHPLRYKPERRFVARLETEDAAPSVLRYYSRSELADVLERWGQVTSRGDLRCPAVLRTRQRTCLLQTEWLPGSSLRELLLREPFDDSLPIRVGATLAELHGQHLGPAPARTLRAQQRTAMELGGWLMALVPEESRLIMEIVAQLIRGLEESRLIRPVLTHGDFYDEQVVVTPERIGILDLDSVAAGPAELDLGSFRARLELAALEGCLSSDRAAAISDLLYEGYSSARGHVDPRRLPIWTALALFRLAPTPFRRLDTDWAAATTMILEAVRCQLRGLNASPASLLTLA